jgi:hypothetical protein
MRTHGVRVTGRKCKLESLLKTALLQIFQREVNSKSVVTRQEKQKELVQRVPKELSRQLLYSRIFPLQNQLERVRRQRSKREMKSSGFIRILLVGP